MSEDLTAVFERRATSVFRTACHLAMGDREVAEQLLFDTFRTMRDDPDQADPDAVAHQLWSLRGDAEAALAARHLTVSGPEEEAEWRPTEHWLDDQARGRVMAMLTVGSDEAATASRPRPMALYGLVAAALVAGGIGVAWLVTRTSPPSTTSAPTSTTEVAPPEAEQTITFTEAPLTDQREVAPDAIVHYPDGVIGLSWTGDCNRPAVRVRFVSTAKGNAIELVTGAFPIISCAGAPSRWTAVVGSIDPHFQVAPLQPLHVDVAVDTENYLSSAAGQAPVTSGPRPGANATIHSSLVDDDGNPWYYGSSCATPMFTRYDSPVGPLYDVRSTRAEVLGGSYNDVATCRELAQRPVLRSTEGRFFPRPNGEPDDRIDCRGPAGSFRDLHSIGPDDGVDKSTSSWTTWDGCLVRGDVITETDLDSRCGYRGARAITLTLPGLGTEPSDTVQHSLTYVGDISGTVPGEREPLQHLRTVPAGTYDTGLRWQQDELWISRDEPGAVYVVHDGDVQRWPLLGFVSECSPTR